MELNDKILRESVRECERKSGKWREEWKQARWTERKKESNDQSWETASWTSMLINAWLPIYSNEIGFQ